MRYTDIEFGILIVARKTKDLLLRTKTTKSQKLLARRKASQAFDFEKLAKSFLVRYKECSSFRYNRYVTSLWDNFNTKAEKAFLPSPSFSFLNDETIMLTMFGGNKYDEELRYLENKYKRSELASLLLEDYVGNPLLVSNKYITSFNTIRQLYLLSLYFEKTEMNISSIKTVVEWGGGYGNMAKLFIRLKKESVTYVMTDTPLFCCLQWIYLSTVFGTRSVRLVTSAGDKIQKGKLNIIPVGLLDSFTNQLNADLFISTWGLSESSTYAQDFVAKRNWFGAEHIFLGFQKSSHNLPTAELVGKLASKKGATVEPLALLPNNSLAYL